MPTIQCFGENYTVDHRVLTYTDGNLAVQVICADGPFGMLSTNVDGVELNESEFCVKTWSENACWALDYLRQNADRFEDTGRTFQSGFVQGPIYRLK
jgi:hypothetical protein